MSWHSWLFYLFKLILLPCRMTKLFMCGNLLLFSSSAVNWVVLSALILEVVSTSNFSIIANMTSTYLVKIYGLSPVCSVLRPRVPPTLYSPLLATLVCFGFQNGQNVCRINLNAFTSVEILKANNLNNLKIIHSIINSFIVFAIT